MSNQKYKIVTNKSMRLDLKIAFNAMHLEKQLKPQKVFMLKHKGL
jgi:hypothetical protein